MELTIKIEAKDLAAAINNLANAISGSKPNTNGTKPNTNGTKPNTNGTKPEEQPQISLDNLLNLAKVCLKDGTKKGALKNLLTELGVLKVSEIPKDKIGYAYEKLKEVA